MCTAQVKYLESEFVLKSVNWYNVIKNPTQVMSNSDRNTCIVNIFRNYSTLNDACSQYSNVK
jgi:hypothetical protein